MTIVRPLPSQWVVTPLEQVVLRIVGGGTPSKSMPEYYQGEIPWMSVKDMNKHVLNDTADHISQQAVDNSSTNVIPAGTPIIATRMSLGKIVVADFDSAINQDLKALFLSQGIDRDFLIYWYRSIAWKIEQLGTGTTVKGIRLEVLKGLELSLPPLAEQKAIAEKLDTLLAQVESTKARLERIPKILKRFRQSVLAAAVSGKLTEEWRKVKGVSDKYEVKALSDIGSVVTGSTPSKKQKEYYGGSFPMFKPGDLDAGYNLEKGSDWLTERGKGVSRLIPSGSTLVTCIGATIGKTGFSRADGSCNQQINAIVPGDGVVPEWVYFLMISPQMQIEILSNSSSTTLPILNKSRFSMIKAPVPILEEQTEIVRRVDQLFAYADTIETQVNNALERVNNLTQSILAKAFRSELTEQWRKDNPDLISGENSAEALLQKIKAERAAAKPVKRGRKTVKQG